MARSVSVLLLLCLALYTINSSHAVPPNPSTGYPQLSNLVHPLIPQFHRQLDPDSNLSQFGFIVLGDLQDGVPPLRVHLEPTDNDGDGPLIDNTHAMSPPNSSFYVNYLAARLQPSPLRPGYTHTEEALLPELDSLVDAYNRNRQHPPTFILLFSWAVPCFRCVDRILQSQMAHQDMFWVVAYTVPPSASLSRSQHNEIQRMEQAHIEVIRVPCRNTLVLSPNLPTTRTPHDELRRKRSAETSSALESCSIPETFQGCLYNRLNSNSITCCSAGNYDNIITTRAAFINSLAYQCFPAYTEQCADSIVIQYSQVCGCVIVETVQTLLKELLADCRSWPLSSPLIRPPPFPEGIITDQTQLSNGIRLEDLPRSSTCLESSEYYLNYTSEGTTYMRAYVTASMTLCRSDHPCGYHGYSYKWCYTGSDNDNWALCCMEPCRDPRDPWCYTSAIRDRGDFWQWCGEAGRVTVSGTPCALDHPCGRHGTHNYLWCYTDVEHNRWEFCCLPTSCCGNDPDNPWCYTGFDFDKRWERCTPAPNPYPRRYCKNQLAAEQDTRVCRRGSVG
ncbi:hypothetical protein BaRGS_00013650 [Batillaria attramentaria]|uniref:Uncharacterized protein n=1 Tax=Batillaria attramentaria TaxID=370345 RepID=A0ABD0L796_9CAEN